jgi:hypothetical protein
MNVRETGIRRIKFVTRGVAVVGVAGSIAFAGLAKAATDSDRADTPKPSGTTSPSPATTAGTGPTKTNTPATRTRTTQPSVTDTHDDPQVTVGGS